MTTIKAWISAARLRTLPLSISGILVGSVLGTTSSFQQNYLENGATVLFFNSPVFWLAILTTLGLQVLSNFANDYGDGVKGTDNENRIGPKRALQSGIITDTQMKKGIIITSIITLFSAILLIYLSFRRSNYSYSIFFFLLGLAAIAAAIKYTVGKSAYGYRGLGDIFVFIFFGLVSILGCYFLYIQAINSWLILFPAITMGCLSTAVLNLNNMRDIENDQAVGKRTLVVKLGLPKAKIYHKNLIGVAIVSFVQFQIIIFTHWIELIGLIAIVPLYVHFKKVEKTEIPEQFDPELKKVALSTFLLALLFSLGQILATFLNS